MSEEGRKMRPYVVLAFLGAMLFPVFALAADETAEEAVSLARLNAEGVKCRIANGKFVLDFKRQWHANEAKLGKKSLITLPGGEPGRFSGVHVNKGLLVESAQTLPPQQNSYADKVSFEITWVGSINLKSDDMSQVMEAEGAALKDVLLKAGFSEESLGSNPAGMRITFMKGLDADMSARLLGELAAGGFWTEGDTGRKMKALADEWKQVKGRQEPSSKEQPKNAGKTRQRREGGPPARMSAEQLDRLEKALLAAGRQYGEKYLEFVQKQALLKGLDLKYTFHSGKISLETLERLAAVVLRMPMIKKQFPAAPGGGMNDHAAGALNFYAAWATNIFDYVTGKQGAAESLSPSDRDAADAAFAFSVEATFTPAESAVPSAPCHAGLLGETLKEIEIHGHTDPKQGSGLQWWLLQTAHPQNFDIAAAPEMASSYAFHWVQREKNAAEIWVRVRAIGDAAGDYTIKCSDTALTKGDAIRVFANDQPLRGDFPY